MWRSLDKSRKEEYFVMARKADAEHKMKYPGKINCGIVNFYTAVHGVRFGLSDLDCLTADRNNVSGSSVDAIWCHEVVFLQSWLMLKLNKISRIKLLNTHHRCRWQPVEFEFTARETT